MAKPAESPPVIRAGLPTRLAPGATGHAPDGDGPGLGDAVGKHHAELLPRPSRTMISTAPRQPENTRPASSPIPPQARVLWGDDVAVDAGKPALAACARRRGDAYRARLIRRRRALSVLWAILPIATLGVATPFLIFFADRRLRSHAIAWSSVGWAAAVIVSFMLAGSTPQPGEVAGAESVVLITLMIGGAFHAFALRPTVFKLDALDADKAARRQAIRIVRAHPLDAVRLGIGRIDLDPRWRLADGGLIDGNNSPAPELARALGLNEAQQATLARVRGESNGFTSAADMSVRVHLDPRLLDSLADRLVFLPMLGSPVRRSPSVRGRALLSVADGRSSGLPTHEAGRGVDLASWAWAVVPLITGSVAAAPAMAFAAARLKDRKLWLAAGAYLAVEFFLAYDSGITGGATWNAAALWTLGAIATLHAFIIRKDVFEVDIVRSDQVKRRYALRLVAQDPQEAVRLRIGRVDVPESDRYPDGGLIDMNNVPADALEAATGISAGNADQIVTVREELWVL